MLDHPATWAAYAGVVVVALLCLLIGEGAHRLIEVPARRFVLRLVPRSRPAVTERTTSEVSA
jgi:peptidoglycan/LPS O-acetylase OafA/YrhL